MGPLASVNLTEDYWVTTERLSERFARTRWFSPTPGLWPRLCEITFGQKRQARTGFSLTYSLCDQSENELLLRVGALRGVAGAAEQLKVVEMVTSTLGLRDDVVDGEVAERKQDVATVAFLPSVERVLVGAVVREVAKVGAPEHVLTVNHVVEQRSSVVAQALEHEPGGQR